MIQIFSCFTKIGLQPLDFIRVLNDIRMSGNKFLILEGKIGLLSAAGIVSLDIDTLKWISCNVVNYENSFDHGADLFVSNNDIFYIINHNIRHMGWENKIELGIITMHPENYESKLFKFCKQVEDVIKITVDGRRVRHFNFGWYQSGTNWEVTSRIYPSGKFSRAVYNDKEVSAANLIKVNTFKELLIMISRSKPLSLSLKPTSVNSNYESSVRILLNNDLLYSDISQNSYKLTPLAKKMINGSHWMTILLTKTLINNGVPLEKIIWSLSEDSEEVDCVVDFRGKTWIFELKDKPFEAGHAHPFIYRAIKYKADKIIIFTTDKVGPNARKIFKDISNNYRAAIDIDSPIFIEGTSSLDDKISDLIKNETISLVNKKKKELNVLTSTNLTPLFNKLFDDYKHSGKKI